MPRVWGGIVGDAWSMQDGSKCGVHMATQRTGLRVISPALGKGLVFHSMNGQSLIIATVPCIPGLSVTDSVHKAQIILIIHLYA